MKRKVGFWRWLLDGAIDLVKNFPKDFIECVRDPFGEMLFGVGIMVLALFSMPFALGPFVPEGPSVPFACLVYLSLTFGLAFLVILHGIYRD